MVGLGGLGVTCSPRDPRFTGSNPAEVDGFFQDVKIPSTSPPGGILSWGLRKLFIILEHNINMFYNNTICLIYVFISYTLEGNYILKTRRTIYNIKDS